MSRVQDDDLPALHSLVTGLKRDQAAVVAGLTLPWNSGAVEGQVCKIKLAKRVGTAARSLPSSADASSTRSKEVALRERFTLPGPEPIFVSAYSGGATRPTAGYARVVRRSVAPSLASRTWRRCGRPGWPLPRRGARPVADRSDVARMPGALPRTSP